MLETELHGQRCQENGGSTMARVEENLFGLGWWRNDKGELSH